MSNPPFDFYPRSPRGERPLKRGKEVVDYQVENALLNKALGGDTTAQIFWLKNRRPDKWRDKPSGDKSADEHIGVIEIGAVKEDNT